MRGLIGAVLMAGLLVGCGGVETEETAEAGPPAGDALTSDVNALDPYPYCVAIDGGRCGPGSYRLCRTGCAIVQCPCNNGSWDCPEC